MNDVSTRARIDSFKERKLCILQDDTSRGSRAVIVTPAENCSAELMNRMISLSRGLVFVAISTERAESLMLEPMEKSSEDSRYPQGLVSVDAREGITTGISASDRALAVQILGSKQANPRDLVKPGHIFPVAVRQGGLLVRNALPEGAYDLSTLTGGTDAAVFMDLLGADGSLLDTAAQTAVADKQHIPLIRISELIQHRLQSEPLVYKVAEAALPTRSSGELRSVVYKSHLYEGEHIALVKGTFEADTVVPTRVQTENTFADVFGGNERNTRSTIAKALSILDGEDCGVFVYLRRSLRGALSSQLLDEESLAPANMQMMRNFGLGAQILRDLGVKKIKILSNTQQRLIGLNSFGLEVVEQQPVSVPEESV